MQSSFNTAPLLGLAALAVLGLAIAPAAQAQNTSITSDTTINTAITGRVYVGLSGNPTVHLVDGGSISSELIIYGESHVFVSGGSVGTDTAAFDSSTLSISGGTFGSQVVGGDYTGSKFSGALNISGGTFGVVGIDGSGALNISGGTFGSTVYAGENSTTTITGGKFPMHVSGADYGFVNDDDHTGTLTFKGTNLSSSILHQNNGDTVYSLSGTLEDGNSLDNVLIDQANSAPMFTLYDIPPPSAPEPSSIAVFAFIGLGAAGLVLKARKRKALDA